MAWFFLVVPAAGTASTHDIWQTFDSLRTMIDSDRISTIRLMNTSGKGRSRGFGLSMVLAALGVLLCLPFSSMPAVSGPILSVDLEQLRANTPLPVPHDSLRIQQTFTPRWDGLREVEITFARSKNAPVVPNGRLRLRLYDDSETLIAEEELANDQLTHNQTYAFRFRAQTRSAGRRYTLQASGNAQNGVSLWGYSLDVYRSGHLTLVSGPLEPEARQTTAKELRFVTRYQLTWLDAAIAVGTMLSRDGPLMLLALWLIPLPGVLLLLMPFNPGRRWDPAAWWGTAYALGIAGWSLLWFVLTLLGGRWRPWSLWAFVIIGWTAAFLLWRWRRRLGHAGDSLENEAEALPAPGKFKGARFYPWKWYHGLLFMLLLLTLALRLLAVRDVAFPLWVDASRHGLITAVMAEQGRVPTHYDPFLPVDRFPYHFGFHTLSASLMLMSQWPLPRLLLFLGQLLNGLLPLTVYAAGWLLTRRQAPSLLTAFWVAVPFFFPAYYATWGRMTQLTAMLLMPLLVAFTWLLLRGGRSWRSAWWLLGLLAAGLFLVHFRVFVYYIPFVAIVWSITFGRHSRWLAAAGGLALLLVGPRIIQLAALTDPANDLKFTIPDYHLFPVSYVKVGWERQFIALALVGLIVSLLFGLRRYRWTAFPLTLFGWVALLFLLLAGERFGLPQTTLVNLNSMYITLFLPLAMFLGITLDQIWRGLRRGPWLIPLASYLVAGVGLMALLLYGARQQIQILNPQTILARSGDLAGLEWAAANLPDTAYLAVNSWLWLGNTWAGSDGGAWLVPLTGLRSTTPPVDYIYDLQLFQSVRTFNEKALAVDDWSTPEAADWLRQQGVTHIFIGVRGGYFDPVDLLDNPALQMIYGQDGVFIFALES